MVENCKFIFVQGTTASGKSQLAVDLALKYQGVIINCDSLQVYRGLDIGTAKPTASEMLKVPHYLFSYVDYPRTMTAGEYTRDFFQTIKDHSHEKLFFVVGGTGFYFMAIEKGMYPVRQPDLQLKNQVEEEIQRPGGAEKLFVELQNFDPEYAKKIHLADHYRLGRAIELIRTEKKTVTQIQAEFANRKSVFPYPCLKIGTGLSKDSLSAQILKRTESMVKAGLVDEVVKALDHGWGDWSPLGAVGYREVLQFLKELKSEEWLIEAIHRSTLQLAKKQRTWFQRDKQIHWFNPLTEFDSIDLKVEQFLSEI